MFMTSCNAQNLLRGLTNLTISNTTRVQNNPNAEIAIYTVLGVILGIMALCCLCACCKALERPS